MKERKMTVLPTKEGYDRDISEHPCNMRLLKKDKGVPVFLVDLRPRAYRSWTLVAEPAGTRSDSRSRAPR